MNFKQLISRCWYYFRLGYGTYLSLPIGLIGWANVIFYLAITNTALSQIFPKFHIFFITATLILIPTGIILGFFHMKKSPIFQTEQVIQAERHPFNYKSYPGKERRLQLPLQYLTTRKLMEMLDKFGLLSEEEREEFRNYLEMIQRLMRGESVS